MTRARGAKPKDEGAALVLVLVFLAFFALLIPGILGLGSSTLKAAEHNDDQRLQQYASESALKREIVRLRDGAQTCGSTAYDTATTTTNGIAVTVACQVVNSVTTLSSHPANTLQAVTSDPAEGVILSPSNGNGGGNAGVAVYGNVSSTQRVDETASGNPFHFIVHEGDVAAAACFGSILVDSGRSKACNAAGPGDPSFPIPAGPFALTPTPTCASNAAVFSPGYYATPPSPPAACATRNEWFMPGTYYFDFLGATPHTWALTGKTVIGGTPFTSDFNPNGAVAPAVIGHSCRTELDDIGGTASPGVAFVFGNDSRIDVSSGSLELCPTYNVGTQAVSVYGAKAAAAATPASLAPTVAASTMFSPANSGRMLGDGLTAGFILPKNTSAVLNLGTLGTQLPASQVVVSAKLYFAHREGDAVSGLSLDVTPGGVSSPTTYTDSDKLTLNASAMHTDMVDVSSLFTDSTTVNGATFAITASTPKKTAATTSEDIDGLRLDVQYLAGGVVRQESGCILTPLSGTSPCYLMDSTVNSKQAMHGTVYAPLAAVRVGVGSQVDYDRGVLARSIELDVSPGHGTEAFGSVQTYGRTVLLTASEAGSPSAKAAVLYRPDPITGDTYESILSWQTLR